MDIKHITDTAKEILLLHKEHAPTFFVEFCSGKISIVALTSLEDATLAKRMRFFQAAREVAIAGCWKAKEVKEICFVVEAWGAAYTPGEKFVRPRDKPKRKELLIVTKLAAPSMKSSILSIEMLRDGSGDLVDLVSHTKEHSCQDSLLSAFLAGIASSGLTDADLEKMMKGKKL